MKCEVARPDRHVECAIPALINRGKAAGHTRTDPAFRHDFGNPIIDRAHHAANRLATVAQCCRTTYDFHALSRQRVNGNGVVFGYRRHVVRSDTIFLNAHAIAI